VITVLWATGVFPFNFSAASIQSIPSFISGGYLFKVFKVEFVHSINLLPHHSSFFRIG
jgi:hypothetical protein